MSKELSKRVDQCEAQISALVDKIVDASSPRIIHAFERKIEGLETEK